MTRIGVLLAALIVSLTARAQVRSISDLLATAGSDPGVTQFQALLGTASGLRMHDPLVRQVALRIGFNGNALGDSLLGYFRNEDAYRLQVGFNSFQERNRQKDIKNARVGLLNAEYGLIQQQAASRRIVALTAWLYTLPALEACRKLDTFLVREQAILREMLTSGVGDVKVSKVLDAEEDKSRNDRDIASLESSVASARQSLVQLTGDFAGIDQSDLATVEDISLWLAEIKTALPATHPAVTAKNARIALESANLDYISSQNRRFVNNLSVGYQYPLFVETRNRFNPQNNFSFRIELLAPLPANNRFKRADALLDLREAQYEAAMTLESVSISAEYQLASVENLIREYNAITDRIENGLIGKMLGNRTLHASISPLDMVELEIALQKMEVARAELLADIGKEYAELLGLTGVQEAKYLLKKR